MPSSHLILGRPLFLLPPIPPSLGFSNESTLCMRWPKYWSLSFSIIPSKEIPGLISFKIDWMDLLAIQGDSQESSPTPQIKSINSLCSAFFTVQLSHPYTTTGKARALTRRFSGVQLFATPWTVSRQAPLSMGVSRQEYWSGLQYPPPGDLPDPGIEPRSPALQVDSL